MSELQEFIDSEAFLSLENIPISPQRATSYLKNPQCSQNNVVLFLAYEEEELVGYRALLPDRIIFENKVISFAWLSGNWVHPAKRRKGIASLLLEHALEAWEYKLMFTNYAAESKAVYVKSGEFVKYASLNGIRVYLRFPLAEVLPPKNSLFRNLKPAFNVFDRLLNTVGDLRFRNSQGNRTSRQERTEEIQSLDEETIDYIKRWRDDNFTCDIVNKLKWIEAWPWILEKSQPDETDKKYFFSSTAQKYENIQLKVYNSENQFVAYLMIIVIGNKLTIPYFFSSKEAITLIPDIILSKMIQFKLSYTTIYHPQLIDEMWKQRKGYIFKKSIPRNYYCSVGLKNNLPDSKKLTWQDGDGDAAFT